jgi:hypothetical protein
MQSIAIVFQQPKSLALTALSLPQMGAADVQVEVEFSGISTGTERLLWEGTMPAFPGMGYPLVPGYETVGRVVDAGDQATLKVGHTGVHPRLTMFPRCTKFIWRLSLQIGHPFCTRFAHPRIIGRARCFVCFGSHCVSRAQRAWLTATRFDRGPRCFWVE